MVSYDIDNIEDIPSPIKEEVNTLKSVKFGFQDNLFLVTKEGTLVKFEMIPNEEGFGRPSFEYQEVKDVPPPKSEEFVEWFSDKHFDISSLRYFDEEIKVGKNKKQTLKSNFPLTHYTIF